ncbi:hypothetical protein C7N43_16680 [Sphingobacteriales bacterium UPWRP_1]|nr:hypothetical protein C7N43_16680 [Sphingobacteriales bacterium UPWRP_1]
MPKSPNRNVLITFLGNNKYHKCTYRFPNKTSPVVRFVQEAICAYLCANWSASDCIYIFMTEGERGSRVTNWEGANYKDDLDDKDGLRDKLHKLNLSCQIVDKTIPEGFTDSDNQLIFSKIYDVLTDGDHVYMDITNAFRSIPMFGSVLVNYASFLLNDIVVESVMYGAFEALGPAHVIQQQYPNPADRVAPILYLTEMVRLQEWTIAANDFIYHGNTRQLAKLSERQGFSNLSAILSNIGGAFATVRGIELENAQLFVDLVTELKSIENRVESEAMKRVLNKLQQELTKFTQPNVVNGFYAAEWCLKHNLIQQGITLLQETIISYICNETGYNKNVFEANRKLIADAMNCKNLPEARWKNVNPALVKTIIAHPTFIGLEPAYNALKKFRNDINHGGFETNWRKFQSFELQLKQSLNQVKTFLKIK